MSEANLMNMRGHLREDEAQKELARCPNARAALDAANAAKATAQAALEAAQTNLEALKTAAGALTDKLAEEGATVAGCADEIAAVVAIVTPSTAA